jgi:glyoxylase-like metal-dependent hydrolase (beta-lactamase superfamily II)
MFTRIALFLILLIAVPYYWLLMDPGSGSVPAQPIDIARLRALADSQRGPRPVAIEYASVATNTVAGTLLVAGGGLRTEESSVFVWRLITPGGDTVINSGLSREQAMASGYTLYRPEIQATANGWLRSARRIIFTSEEIDHLGGLIMLMVTDADTPAKVTGNAEQVSTLRQLVPAVGKALPPPLAALSGPPGYAAMAPGISALRTPGHLPGTQMIYVRLQDGREYLFVGDTAPMRRNVEWLRPRSRYAAQWLGTEDRAATMAWIKGLADLQAREPGIKFVYGHDLGWMQDQVKGPRFAPAPATLLPKEQDRKAR